jgi:flagellar hook protein FlgE
LGSLQSYQQGAYENSSSALDLAVDGNGFFIVNDGTGNFYTRAGQFAVNANGLVQNITGDILQGFPITNNVVGTTLTDVSLANVQSQPQPTTEFTLGAQLDASVINGTLFNSPIQIFNSIGTQDILSIQFQRDVPNNEWDFTISSSVTGAVVTANALGSLQFGPTGQLVGVNGVGNLTDLTITVDYTGATPPANIQNITWDLVDATPATNGSMTSFAAPSANNSVIQDGFGSGILIGVAVDFDGTVAGLFDNGQSQPLFQLGLANFLAPTGLARTGQNLFAETRLSGQPTVSLPQTGALGSVLGNTLELSNVDLAEEFVQLIKTQQAFQASARVISTTDDLLTETVNLTR